MSTLFIYYSVSDQNLSLLGEEPGSAGIPLPGLNDTTLLCRLRVTTQWFDIPRAPDRNSCSQNVVLARHFLA